MAISEVKKSLLGIVACIITFILGQILLEVVSKFEDPPLGNTFYIILGCVLIVASLLGIYFLIDHIRHIRKKKERRKRSKIVFLNDEKHEEK